MPLFKKDGLLRKVIGGMASGGVSEFFKTKEGENIKTELIEKELNDQKYKVLAFSFGGLVLFMGVIMAFVKGRK